MFLRHPPKKLLEDVMMTGGREIVAKGDASASAHKCDQEHRGAHPLLRLRASSEVLPRLGATESMCDEHESEKSREKGNT